jgi:hypothetical protein
MKTKLILLTFLAISYTSQAQFGDLLNKASNAVQSKIEKKISKKLESKSEESNQDSEQKTDNATTKPTNNTQEYPGKLYFSNQPFKNSTDIGHAKTDFVAGDEIYGMVVMKQNFSEINDDEDKPFKVTFYVDLINLEGRGSASNTAFQANIHQKYNKQNYLFFDVSPAPAKAISYTQYEFERIGFLLGTVSGNEMYGDKPKLGNERTYQAGFKIGYKDYAKGNFTIDYTKATKTTMKTWLAREHQAFEMANANVLKANNDEAADVASSLPLPKSFLQPSASPYSDPKYSKANIMAILKNRDEVKQLLKFMFVKTTATNDFELYKTPLGQPDYKWGNRFFQFIFKDANGKCLASGGRLKMDYEGGGKYSAPYILWEYADVGASEGFLQDTDLKAYVVDCNKVK